MNPEDVKLFLEYLMTKGEILASEGFRLAYQQAIYWGISDLIWAVVSLVFFIISFRIFMKIMKVSMSGEYRSDHEEDIFVVMWQNDIHTVVGTLSAIFGFFSAIFVPFLLSCGLNWLANPEMGAIRILLSYLPAQ